MKETAILTGSHRALFGICTEAESPGRFGAIILNAGLLHHVGPFRLHVILGRALAGSGIPTIRLDQSGKGESPARQGVSFEESMLLDFDDALGELNKRGVEQVFIIGLCSGADDALYIAQHRPDVAGLVSMDGYAARTPRYSVSRYGRKALNAGAWYRAAGRVTRRLASSIGGNEGASALDIRNWSSKEEMLAEYRQILQNNTHILATFTNGASEYYNYQGQLADALGKSSAPGTLEEIYYAETDHLFTIAAHRQTLVEDIQAWTNGIVKDSGST